MQPFQQTPPSWGRIEGPSTRFSPSPSSTTGDVGSLSSGQFRGRLLGDATIDTRGRFPLGEDHSRSSADITQQFKYNTRISMALLPSLAIVAVYGGSSVAACLVVCVDRVLNRRDWMDPHVDVLRGVEWDRGSILAILFSKSMQLKLITWKSFKEGQTDPQDSSIHRPGVYRSMCQTAGGIYRCVLSGWSTHQRRGLLGCMGHLGSVTS